MSELTPKEIRLLKKRAHRSYGTVLDSLVGPVCGNFEAREEYRYLVEKRCLLIERNYAVERLRYIAEFHRANMECWHLKRSTEPLHQGDLERQQFAALCNAAADALDTGRAA